MVPNEREYLVRKQMYQDHIKEAEQARLLRNATPAKTPYKDRFARLMYRFGNQLVLWGEQITYEHNHSFTHSMKGTLNMKRRTIFSLVTLLTLTFAFVGLPSTSSAQVIMCQGTVATIVGTPLPDVLFGVGGADVIAGLAGDDDIIGAGGNDVLCGMDGDDSIAGNPGHDKLYGGNGMDRLAGGHGDDTLYGGPGDDWLDGGSGYDTCVGGPGVDVYFNCEVVVP